MIRHRVKRFALLFLFSRVPRRASTLTFRNEKPMFDQIGRVDSAPLRQIEADLGTKGRTRMNVFRRFAAGVARDIAEIRKHKMLFLLCVPGIVFFLCFSYLPMFGVIIAFKNFRIGHAILSAPWAEPLYKNFVFFFTSGHAWRVTRNTLYLNVLFIGSGTIVQVALALLLNEIRSPLYKRVSQSVMLLPHFMSWIVISVIVKGLFASDTGTINNFLTSAGLSEVNWYGTANLWPPILVFTRIWKGAGWGAIIYLATIAGMDPGVYEAATIDGASRFQQMFRITLPMLVPTIIMLTILSVGKIFYGDVGMIYGIIGDNVLLQPTVDVIDTYVLRALRSLGNIGMASAIGLWQSVMGLLFVLGANALARRYDRSAALF